MATSKTKTRKKRVSKKKKGSFATLTRVISFLLLVLLLAISLCTVGYVIFFRTVLAREIIPALSDAIVFEEPDPPVREDVVLKEDITIQPDLPKVAIVIDDMGYHKSVGEQLLALSVDLSYSFLPFAPHTKEQEEMAREKGKMILLHLPLQPKDNKWDPGPGALFLDDSPEVQREKFKQALQEVPGAKGVNNHMGSLFTENVPAMKVLLEGISERSLYFVDSYTTAKSVGLRLAREMNIRAERRNVFLDNELSVDKVCKQIEKLVDTAEKKGAAIGIGHPHEATLKGIATCTGDYSGRVEFVGVQDVLH